MHADSQIKGNFLKKSFGEQVKSYLFPEMNHGWMSRGDLTQPNVDRDFKKGLEMSLDYIRQFH